MDENTQKKYGLYSREDAKNAVNKGWYSLIDKIFDNLPDDTYVMQVKEKFGGLRFYTSGIDNKTAKLINDIEKESYKICEVCGEPGKLRNDLPWILTLCLSHYILERRKFIKK